jgi:integrase
VLTKRRHRHHRVRVVPYRHPKFRWTIAGLFENGKRVRRFFQTRSEAETFVSQRYVLAQNLGTRASRIDQSFYVMAVECADTLASFGKDLRDATEHYVRHLETSNRSRHVEDVLSDFLVTKERDGKGQRYLGELRSRLGKFVSDFGGKLLSDIGSVEIDDWLRGLPVAPLTRNHFRRNLGTFFAYAVARQYCASNPVPQTSKAVVKSSPIAVLTPDQTQRLLDCAHPSIRPMLAIGAFAGLRPAEIARLDWREVNLDRSYIEVTAAKSKTASRRLVKILPNLKEWLVAAQRRVGPVTPANTRKLVDAARIQAGFEEWPSNALRHGFASYHLGAFSDAAALALEMGHTTTAMLFSHYREVVTQENAERYWRIIPRAIP